MTAATVTHDKRPANLPCKEKHDRPRLRSHFHVVGTKRVPAKGHDRFFHGERYLADIARAFGIEPEEWHSNLMPKALHPRFGNRGCLMVHDDAHGAWIDYCTMGVGKKKRGRKHWTDPVHLFAYLHDYSPDERLSAELLWQYRARLLVKAELIELSPRLYCVLDWERVLQAFPKEQFMEWRVAVAMLDAVTEQRDILLLQPDSKLVHKVPYVDGRQAVLVYAQNKWLAHWCGRYLRVLCGDEASLTILAQTAGELRKRLYNAGLLAREHVRRQRWMIGPVPLPSGERGLSREELLAYHENPLEQASLDDRYDEVVRQLREAASQH